MKYILIFILSITIYSCGSVPTNVTIVALKPSIYPMLDSVVLPPNISPLNFKIENKAEDYFVEFTKGSDMLFSIESSDENIAIPHRKWLKLSENGGEFNVVIYTKTDGKWSKFEPLTAAFAKETIDDYLSYRLIAPGYELWDKMGIYQRNLTSYSEEPILTNSATEGGCMNCHSYANYSSQTLMLHLRGDIGGTLIKKDGEVSKHTFKTPEIMSEGIYPSWNPSERYIAFSVNEINQYFHVTGNKPIEVSDASSDIVVYDLQRNEIFTDSLIFGSHFMESFPEWSNDGKTLYFTRAAAVENNANMDSIFYALCSVDFDLENRTISNFKVLVDRVSDHKSISFPRVAPGGNYLVYTLSDYGNFSIWHEESDLWLLDLTTLKTRPICEVNSSKAESYHSFSSNGNWMVFSSRRDDGLYTRPYICHFDTTTAIFSRPFVLPQERGDFYDSQFCSYNLPKFTKDAVKDQRQLLNKAVGKDKKAAKFAGVQ
ncbi:MAG: cytochrome C biosynthesis protein [Rikenellaceae bacterium]